MFEEKKEEWNSKEKTMLPVVHLGKYKEAKNKGEELIAAKMYGLDESNFWILKTFNKEKCFYSGLIVSHNGCLKINDTLPVEKQFKPQSVAWVSQTPGNLALAYINCEQGLYEFGEASFVNCKNDYPYAMVLKRLQDRVILKLSKLAYSGVMSESESDEFSRARNEDKSAEKNKPNPEENKQKPKINELSIGSDSVIKINAAMTQEALVTACKEIKADLGTAYAEYEKSAINHYKRREAEIKQEMGH